MNSITLEIDEQLKILFVGTEQTRITRLTAYLALILNAIMEDGGFSNYKISYEE